MRVLVTGGTGFVGSHAVAALRARGHEPVVLARRPAAVPALLAPLGCGAVDVRQGDVTDGASVRAALVGCEAVIHCGSVFSFDPARVDDIRRTNVTGTEIVLDEALAAGCDPVVHMSSTLALLPASGVLDAHAPTQHDGPPYARSKADSERVARARQAAGEPVVTVLSGWVWGPDDPRLGESSAIVCDLVAGRLPVCPPGRASVVDVRDLGALLAALIAPGEGPRRLLAAGTPTTFPELAVMLGALTGRPRRVREVPAAAARWAAAAADHLRRFGPRLPATGEGTWAYLCAPQTDDGDTWSHLERPRRPLEQTVADQLGWLVEHGHVRVAAGAPVRQRSPG